MIDLKGAVVMDLQIDPVQKVEVARPAVQPVDPLLAERAVRRAADATQDRPNTGTSGGGRPPASSSAYAQFRIDPDSHRVQIKLIDQQTGEVLLEVPPETILRLAAELKRQSGVIFEAKR